MTKQTWKPGTMLAPLPPALITSGNMEHPNVMTAAWTGIICSDPVITYVSLRPSRYTHELVSRNKEFVINLPTWRQAEAVDTVGVKSGRDGDKFALTGLTAEPCAKVKAPQVAECPVSLECKVLEVRPFGTHDMFLAEVVAVNVDEQYIDESGALDLEKAGLIAYAHGFYYTLGRKIGKFGFSVEKKKKKPAAPSVATVLKADEKFSRKKITAETIAASCPSAVAGHGEPKIAAAGQSAPHASGHDETFIENGVEVIVKKSRFSKTPTQSATPYPADKNARRKGKDSRAKGENNRVKGENSRSKGKFSRKDHKQTNYEPYSFKKKADGSFKKKSPRRA